MKIKKSWLLVGYLGILSGVLFMAKDAVAYKPNDLNMCSAWLSTYSQFHDDKNESILSSEFDAEMKRLDQYDLSQIEAALDSDVMLSAASKGEKTQEYLDRCTKIALDFTKTQ